MDKEERKNGGRASIHKMQEERATIDCAIGIDRGILQPRCVCHGPQKLHRAHEERAAAYSMYLPESNEPSEDKQHKILAFAVGADRKQPASDGNAADE